MLLILGALSLLSTAVQVKGAELDPTSAASPLQTAHWKDLSGHEYDLAAVTRNRATVFLFISTQCPISGLYTPRILELWKAYHPQGIGFFVVDSSVLDPAPALQRYARSHGYTFPVVKDRGTDLADRLAASNTPEAIVVDATGTVRYRGRIDDNVNRSRVIQHDLRDSLDAILSGKPVPHPRRLAFGCLIFRQRPVAASPVSAGAATYARDVAPILYRNCSGCHHTGGSAPFALESYAQARTWSTQIRDYTTRGLMPPWKAAPGYGDFKDARYLTSGEIALLSRWVNSGAPEGKRSLTPPLPHYPPTDRWALGQPDLILKFPRPFHTPAEGSDIYREFVLPAQFDTDKLISGIELRPDNHLIVHHIILYIDTTGEAEKLDGKETEPGYTVASAGILPPDSPHAERPIFAQGWAAGNSPAMLPPGVAIRVPAHARLVLQVHYHLDGQPEADQSAVGLHFADPSRVDKILTVAQVGEYRLDLKPGLSHQEVRKSLVLPVDVHVWSVSPHMHMLGRQMKMTATLPDGKVIPMVWVKDWDFNWQESYRYKEPLALPRGTRIDMLAAYDNSEQNPRQTSHPPKEVHFGEQTTDEMCIGFFSVTADQQHLEATNRRASAAGG